MSDPLTPGSATTDPRAIGANECPRCGETYNLDGCGCPSTSAAHVVLMACGHWQPSAGDRPGLRRSLCTDCGGERERMIVLDVPAWVTTNCDEARDV